MNQVSFNITQSEEEGTQITVFIDGKPYAAGEDHPSFNKILTACRTKDFAALPALFDVGTAITQRLERISERVSIDADRVYFDAEPLFGRVTEVLLEAWRAGRHFMPLVNFLENLMQNPSENSRKQLYEFLERYTFAITEDGHFLAHKGVRPDRTSVHAGPGVVNGDVFKYAHLPNPDGAIVELGRDVVVENPELGCAVGLHVGTYDYARSFAKTVLLIKVNPRDVVSVPHDYTYQKVRVTRYQVLREIENDLTETYYTDEGEEAPEDFWLDDEYDESEDDDEAWGEDDNEDWEEEYPGLCTRGASEEEFLAELENAVSALESEAVNYTFKGRMGPDYLTLSDRLGFDADVADFLDFHHNAKQVYRYHVERLRGTYL